MKLEIKSKSKKSFLVLLTLVLMSVLVLSFALGRISSQTNVSSNVYATGESGTCGDNLNWSYNTSTHVLSITGTGTEMTDYLTVYAEGADDAPWYQYKNEVVEIDMSGATNLTKIGHCAFTNFSALQKVTVPNTIESLGLYSFYNCFNLSKVNSNTAGEYNIPASVTFDSLPFVNCFGARKIVLNSLMCSTNLAESSLFLVTSTYKSVGNGYVWGNSNTPLQIFLTDISAMETLDDSAYQIMITLDRVSTIIREGDDTQPSFWHDPTFTTNTTNITLMFGDDGEKYLSWCNDMYETAAQQGQGTIEEMGLDNSSDSALAQTCTDYLLSMLKSLTAEDSSINVLYPQSLTVVVADQSSGGGDSPSSGVNVNVILPITASLIMVVCFAYVIKKQKQFN